MTGISTLLLYKLNLISGKIQNLIELSAFLYQGSYFSPTENIKEGGVNKKKKKKNCFHSIFNFYKKIIILYGVHFLYQSQYTAWQKHPCSFH